MTHAFFALISRMKNISRWALMRNSSPENVQEHSHMTAVLAHALAVIRRDVFGVACDPGAAATAALFHDATEIFTGDMPTPVKYLYAELTSAYRLAEAEAERRLVAQLPAELQATYEPLIAGGDDDIRDLVKAADKLSAYIKCLEEERAGNREFRQAREQTRAKLESLEMPEVAYFIEHFLKAFELTIDEINTEN